MYIMAICAGNRVADYYTGGNYHVHIIFSICGKIIEQKGCGELF
jgi:Fe2+ or Zn2+ uptake regulation protein